MTKSIRRRQTPKTLHGKTKSEAKLAGTPVSGSWLNEAGQIANRPSIEELRTRLRQFDEISRP